MQTFWHITCSGSLLIAAVLLLRRLAYHRLPKRVFVLMWCMILVRFLIPYSIPVKQVAISDSITNQLIPMNELSSGKDAGYRIGDVSGSENISKNTPAGNTWKESEIWLLMAWIKHHTAVKNALITVWALVGSLMAVWILSKHIRWLKRYHASLPAKGALLQAWQNSHHGVRTIQIRCSDQIATPLTYGLLHPVILLPANLQWENEQDLYCILEHERLHIKYFDICTKYFMCLALCIYWFHPLVWLMYILLGRDMEAACDEEVLHRFRSVSKSDYALLLIQMADWQTSDSALGASFSNYKEMKERITSIMKSKKYTIPAAALAILVLFGIVCTFTVSVQQAPVDTPTEFSKSDDALAASSQEDPLQASSTPQEEILQASSTSQGEILQTSSIPQEEVLQASSQKGTQTGVTGSQIVELAKLYVGSPYEYGGTDLETGVDGSGFIKAVFALKGITLPHSSKELSELGTHVELNQLAEGDLIIYGTVNDDQSFEPDHPAIYIGDGSVIHASNAKEGIKISELEYREPYLACRILTTQN